MVEPENDNVGIDERLNAIETRLTDIVARLNDIAGAHQSYRKRNR